MIFFQSVDYKCVKNWNLTNNHFEMESDKHYELDKFIKFISNIHLNDWLDQMPSVIWNVKWTLLYYVYHKYTHGFLDSDYYYYYYYFNNIK
jgi:hypothetical protein